MEIDRINLLIVLSGKSQIEIAKQLGVSKGQLNNYLTGKRKINEIVKKGICEMLNVPEKVLTQHTVHMTLKNKKLMIL